jgi:hypothetical protein
MGELSGFRVGKGVLDAIQLVSAHVRVSIDPANAPSETEERGQAAANKHRSQGLARIFFRSQVYCDDASGFLRSGVIAPFANLVGSMVEALLQLGLGMYAFERCDKQIPFTTRNKPCRDLSLDLSPKRTRLK